MLIKKDCCYIVWKVVNFLTFLHHISDSKEENQEWWVVELHREEVLLQLQACVGGSRAAVLVEEEPLVVQQDPCFSSTPMMPPVSRSPLMLSLSWALVSLLLSLSFMSWASSTLSSDEKDNSLKKKDPKWLLVIKILDSGFSQWFNFVVYLPEYKRSPNNSSFLTFNVSIFFIQFIGMIFLYNISQITTIITI